MGPAANKKDKDIVVDLCYKRYYQLIGDEGATKRWNTSDKMPWRTGEAKGVYAREVGGREVTWELDGLAKESDYNLVEPNTAWSLLVEMVAKHSVRMPKPRGKRGAGPAEEDKDNELSTPP